MKALEIILRIALGLALIPVLAVLWALALPCIPVLAIMAVCKIEPGEKLPSFPSYGRWN